MSFEFSKTSEERLSTVSPVLQKIIRESLRTSLIDFGIPQYGGKRTLEEQKALYNCRPRKSKCDGVKKQSYHQTGNAIDIVIYVNGGYTYDTRYYYLMAHHIMATAKRLGYTNLRWGGDWDKDWDLDDQKFNDLVHFELN